jgi:Holliday junction resolvasome RuvABC endonuclease subunit
MNILSLDLATKKTGFAIFINRKLDNFGLIQSTEGNYQERILCTREKIVELIKKHKIKQIVLEEVGINPRNNLIVAHDLCVCQGVILDLCCIYKLGLKLYAPSSWRALMGTYDGTRAGMKREVQKEKAISIVNELYGYDFKYFKSDTKKNISDDDICEAILMGLAFLKEVE